MIIQQWVWAGGLSYKDVKALFSATVKQLLAVLGLSIILLQFNFN